MAAAPALPRDLFAFLEGLEAHNDRDWFQENKERYEASVRGPALELVGALGARLHKVSPHFVADAKPVGGSLSRIQRDTRFSKDKSPYRTEVSLKFPHRDAPEEAGGPFYYLRLAPAGCFLAAGVKHPGTQALGSIRAAIAEAPDAWENVVRAVPPLEGESAKRVPPGFTGKERHVEDILRKEFVTSVPFTRAQVLGKDFADRCGAAATALAPLARFTTEALGLPW